MRTKLTALLTACAVLIAGAVAAHAAPISVAVYSFSTQDDVNAFQKVSGGTCKRKWQGNQLLAIGVGQSTNNCVYRTSVLSDSSNAHPDLGMVGSVAVSGGTPKLQKKSYVGLGVRQSDDASYSLRVLPTTHKWQYFRDPEGPGGPKLEASGSGKFVKAGRKANVLALRAFAYGGSTTTITGTVNGRPVVSTTDSGADQPNGRRTVVMVGVKGAGAGTGVTGFFDQVAVQVPNPF
jgi:hypothetical protein